MPKWIERFAQHLVQLPRSRKRLLMLLADVVGIPCALWCAISLRMGTWGHPIPNWEWLYVAGLATTIPIFVRMGLYRAVIRYLGPKAVLTVLAGVAVSVVLLTALNEFGWNRALPLGVFPIYWAFALIYVGGTRFIVR